MIENLLLSSKESSFVVPAQFKTSSRSLSPGSRTKDLSHPPMSILQQLFSQSSQGNRVKVEPVKKRFFLPKKIGFFNEKLRNLMGCLKEREKTIKNKVEKGEIENIWDEFQTIWKGQKEILNEAFETPEVVSGVADLIENSGMLACRIIVHLKVRLQDLDSHLKNLSEKFSSLLRTFERSKDFIQDLIDLYTKENHIKNLFGFLKPDKNILESRINNFREEDNIWTMLEIKIRNDYDQMEKNMVTNDLLAKENQEIRNVVQSKLDKQTQALINLMDERERDKNGKNLDEKRSANPKLDLNLEIPKPEALLSQIQPPPASSAQPLLHRTNTINSDLLSSYTTEKLNLKNEIELLNKRLRIAAKQIRTLKNTGPPKIYVNKEISCSEKLPTKKKTFRSILKDPPLASQILTLNWVLAIINQIYMDKLFFDMEAFDLNLTKKNLKEFIPVWFLIRLENKFLAEVFLRDFIKSVKGFEAKSEKVRLFLRLSGLREVLKEKIDSEDDLMDKANVEKRICMTNNVFEMALKTIFTAKHGETATTFSAFLDIDYLPLETAKKTAAFVLNSELLEYDDDSFQVALEEDLYDRITNFSGKTSESLQDPEIIRSEFLVKYIVDKYAHRKVELMKRFVVSWKARNLNKPVTMSNFSDFSELVEELFPKIPNKESCFLEYCDNLTDENQNPANNIVNIISHLFGDEIVRPSYFERFLEKNPAEWLGKIKMEKGVREKLRNEFGDTKSFFNLINETYNAYKDAIQIAGRNSSRITKMNEDFSREWKKIVKNFSGIAKGGNNLMEKEWRNLVGILEHVLREN